MGNHIKTLERSMQTMSTAGPPSTDQTSTLSQKVIRFFKHDLSLVNHCWFFPVTVLPLTSSGSQQALFHNFPRDQTRLMCLSFTGSSFKPFLQMDSTLAFLQSPGTSPNLHNFSEIMESGLAMVSHSSQHPQQILPGPINLQDSGSCNSSHTNPSLTDSGSVLTPTWISVPKAWGPTVLDSQRWRKCLRISVLLALGSAFP